MKNLLNHFDHALLMVLIGVCLTLLQMLGLYVIFEDDYTTSRAVINTMNIAAPLMCFGFDITAPQITKTEKNASFIWNFISLHLFLLVIFVICSFLAPDEKVKSIFLGLSLASIFASKIIVVEFERTLGFVKQYFFNLHVRDRFYRTLAILLIGYLFTNIDIWSALLIIFSLIYLFVIIYKYKDALFFNFKQFKNHIYICLPFFISAIAVVFIYRAVFYVSYFFDTNLITAKIDLWLIIALFILIPMMNISKYAETQSKGNLSVYIKEMQKSWKKITQQQFLIILMIFALTAAGIYLDKVEKNDLILFVFPMVLSMLIVSTIPSFFYLALLKGRIKISAYNIFTILLLSLTVYSLKFYYPEIPATYLLLLNCILYTLFTLIMSKFFLGVHTMEIFRIKGFCQLFIFLIICFNLFILVF